MLIDEGAIEEKIEVELCNKKLIEDLYSILKDHYILRPISTRKRFSGYHWDRGDLSESWNLNFSIKSCSLLYKSISPLSIVYKEKNLQLLFKLKERKYTFNSKQIKEDIIKTLSESPKTIEEIAQSTIMHRSLIRKYLYGKVNGSNLLELGIIEKCGEKILRKGGFTRAPIFQLKL